MCVQERVVSFEKGSVVQHVRQSAVFSGGGRLDFVAESVVEDFDLVCEEEVVGLSFDVDLDTA